MALIRLRDAAWFRRSAGIASANYLRLVWATTRFTVEPEDIYAQADSDLPAIVTLWHGQHFLVPFIRRATDRAKALISMHRDADINAIAAEYLGAQTIRGSGAHSGEFVRKRGVSAFRDMVDALEEGYNVMLTADVPKISRVVGRGIVMLARISGRPVYPLGIATRHRIELKNWDRTAINLPFGRGAIVCGEIVRVPADADDAVMEVCRRRIEDSLNRATARAYAIVDAPKGKAARG